jgi:trans-2,3-dihydro-3-hydroxyanthranilate isomerase
MERPALELEYFVVDVFTDAPLKGNPLAVVMDTAGLSTGQMQAIAREFNLSETTFVQRRDAAIEQAEGVRLRIFTAQEELNFAGHPTLGAAGVLKLFAPETVRSGTVTLAENVGPIPVRFEGNSLFAEMAQQDPAFGAQLDRGKVADLIGLDAGDLHPELDPQIVSTGTEFAIVPLRSAEPLSRLSVRQREAMDWLRPQGARWFFVLCTAPVQNQNTTKWARMQFNGGEDPATGSAAGCAIAYLVMWGDVGSGERVHLRQGIEIGRPSDLFLSATLHPSPETAWPTSGGRHFYQCAKKAGSRVTDVRVGGSTVLVAQGRLFLP